MLRGSRFCVGYMKFYHHNISDIETYDNHASGIAIYSKYVIYIANWMFILELSKRSIMYLKRFVLWFIAMDTLSNVDGKH